MANRVPTPEELAATIQRQHESAPEQQRRIAEHHQRLAEHAQRVVQPRAYPTKK